MTRAWRAWPPTGACAPRPPAKIPSWLGPAPHHHPHLTNGGHLAAAIAAASSQAARLDRDVAADAPESLSVYGSLLLRGAIAAAEHRERDTAPELLTEADDAARQLGADANLRWTAFGPVNAHMYPVNIAVTLGDAGNAVDVARRIDLSATTSPSGRTCTSSTVLDCSMAGSSPRIREACELPVCEPRSDGHPLYLLAERGADRGAGSCGKKSEEHEEGEGRDEARVSDVVQAAPGSGEAEEGPDAQCGGREQDSPPGAEKGRAGHPQGERYPRDQQQGLVDEGTDQAGR